MPPYELPNTSPESMQEPEVKHPLTTEEKWQKRSRIGLKIIIWISPSFVVVAIAYASFYFHHRIISESIWLLLCFVIVFIIGVIDALFSKNLATTDTNSSPQAIAIHAVIFTFLQCCIIPIIAIISLLLFGPIISAFSSIGA